MSISLVVAYRPNRAIRDFNIWSHNIGVRLSTREIHLGSFGEKKKASSKQKDLKAHFQGFFFFFVFAKKSSTFALQSYFRTNKVFVASSLKAPIIYELILEEILI